MVPDRWRRAFTAALAALLLLEILWEIWLAPLRPGAYWLALKALPLALLWRADPCYVAHPLAT